MVSSRRKRSSRLNTVSVLLLSAPFFSNSRFASLIKGFFANFCEIQFRAGSTGLE